MSVTLSTKYLSGFVRDEEFEQIWPQVQTAHDQLTAHTGPGNDFLGWLDLPVNYDKEEFERIKKAAARSAATATCWWSSVSGAAIWAPAPRSRA